MTVPTEDNKAGPYAGAGVGPYSGGSLTITTSAEIRVVLTTASGNESDLVLTSDYSVSIDSNGNFTVTTVSSYTSSEKITIVYSLPATQLFAPDNQAPWVAKNHEDAYDKLTRLVQETREENDRSVKVPVSSSLDPDDVFQDFLDGTLTAVAYTSEKQLSLYNSLADAIASIASNDVNLIIDTDDSLTGNLIVPANIALRFVKGNIITTSTNSLTILGPIIAGSWQLFNSTGGSVLSTSNIMKVNPYWWGIVGDGATSDVTSITNAFSFASDGSAIYFPPAASSYYIDSAIVATDKDLFIDAGIARFTLSGDNAGFQFHGDISRLRWAGGVFQGDNTNRDSDSTLAQAALIVGNVDGDDIADVIISDLYCNQANIGIKIADGRSSGDTVDRVIITNCTILGAVGFVGGVGYGIQISQAPGVSIKDCNVEDCQRHGIYVSEGRNARVTGCEVVGCGKGDGTIRGAMSISRTANVVISACLLHDNADCALAIDTDSQGLAPDNICRDIEVSGCTFSVNDYGSLRIGTSANPAVDGVPGAVTISDCTIREQATPLASAITVNQCDILSISNITIDARDVTGTFRAVTLTGTGGEAYTKGLKLDNIHVSAANSSGSYVVQVAVAIYEGSQQVEITNILSSDITGSLIEYVAGSAASVTNAKLYIEDGSRTLTNAGATPWVAGAEQILLTNSSPQDLSNFTGGRPGESIVIIFTDGNTTVKNSNFYVAAAADWNPAQNDTISMSKRPASLWYEVCRSDNTP